ncbi:hypothetical protein SAMN05216327_12342 [Dyadobacter sp. SG02]|nr:hypothetical protein SAMN05216327_12342 [Dyadobacter sp. SG02]
MQLYIVQTIVMTSFVVEKMSVVQNGVRATLASELPEYILTMYESLEEIETVGSRPFHR